MRCDKYMNDLRHFAEGGCSMAKNELVEELAAERREVAKGVRAHLAQIGEVVDWTDDECWQWLESRIKQMQHHRQQNNN